MSIMIVNRNGWFAPQIFCDRCGLLITDFADAGVTFPLSGNGMQAFPRFLCKTKQCLSHADEDTTSVGWQELGHFLCFLMHNIGLRKKTLLNEIRASETIANLM